MTKRFVNLAVTSTDGAIGTSKRICHRVYIGQNSDVTDVNHAQGDAKHPFNNAANWKEVEHSKHQDNYPQAKLTALHLIRLRPAVRIRMKKQMERPVSV